MLLLLFAQLLSLLLLLLSPCLGLSILPPTSYITTRRGRSDIGGVRPRIGTFDINGDHVTTTTARTTVPPTRSSSSGLVQQQQRARLTDNSRMTNNWSNRGMYINRDISTSSSSSSTATWKINLLHRGPTSTNTTPLYCLMVTLQIKPERHSDFLSCISNNQYHTLTSEPYAITYIYGQDTTTTTTTMQPNTTITYHFFEQYTHGKDGFIAHTNTKHFHKWQEFVTTDPFISSPIVQFFIEDPSSAAAAQQQQQQHSSSRMMMIRDALLAYSGNGYHATIKLYCKNVQLIVIPEKRIDFLNALRAVQSHQQRALQLPLSTTTNNNDIVTSTFGQDVEQMNTFYIFEAYTTNSGQEQQQQQEEERFMKEFLVSPPKIDYYEIQLPYGVMN